MWNSRKFHNTEASGEPAIIYIKAHTRDTRLTEYISAAVKHMHEVENDDKIHIFKFSGHYATGCSFHPDKKEHEKIAEELLPFFKKTMNW